jgi:hypothetical protein
MGFFPSFLLKEKMQPAYRQAGSSRLQNKS